MPRPGLEPEPSAITLSPNKTNDTGEDFQNEFLISTVTRMDLEEIGINAGNWVDSAQDRNYWRALANAALNPGFHKPWSLIVTYYCPTRFC